MKTLQQWFSEYGESHQNPTNQKIHKICVPLIFFCVVGLLLEIPFHIGPLRLGFVFLGGAALWYLTLGAKAFFVMLVQLLVAYLLWDSMRQIGQPLLWLIGIFILAWIGQFWGHRIEGKKPSFIKDLQFLLIGPLWVVKSIFFTA